MKVVYKILGGLMCVGGVFAGIYVGLVVMFVGGIIQVVEGFQEDPVDASQIAWGVVRSLAGGIAGWATAIFLIVVGVGLWTTGSYGGFRKAWKEFK